MKKIALFVSALALLSACKSNTKEGDTTTESGTDTVAVQEEADRIANMTYAEKREEAYPTLEEQADMQFHDSVDNTTTWVDAIQAIKNTYPKP